MNHGACVVAHCLLFLSALHAPHASRIMGRGASVPVPCFDASASVFQCLGARCAMVLGAGLLSLVPWVAIGGSCRLLLVLWFVGRVELDRGVGSLFGCVGFC